MANAYRRLSVPWLFVFVLLSLALPAGAQTPPQGSPPDPASWAGQLDNLVRWVEQHRGPQACTEHCFALDRLRLSGSIDPGPLTFDLEGAVLAEGPVAVPLFGPPGHVRLENVTENGHPAAVSFADGHYYVVTSSRRFVLHGSLALQDDLALAIPGPLNTLEAELTGARVVEGTRLAGLADATIHFDRGAAEPAAAGPTVFQLSHAVRFGREIGFTWRLALQSGTDLGVVRLPLRFGERVLDVTGSTGWRVDGTDLLLPTAGRSAEITVTGTLGSVTSFSPDPRSEYEWWLLESDAEHRVSITGDARQMDSAESPIPRTQPSARLYLVQRGHTVNVAVQTLAGVDALAAVVHRHDRTVVLTRRGDLVSDDTVAYENNGIDYLLYAPQGPAIFLATDGTSQRIMHRDRDAAEILVPLQTGSHQARVQAQSRATIGMLGGALDLPSPTYPLTASRVTVTVGLPSFVVPIAVVGGDEDWFAFSAGDAVAVALGFAAAFLALRTRARRALGAVFLGGLWFVSPALYTAALGTLAVAGAWWLLGRLFHGSARTAARGIALAGGGLAAVIAIAVVGAFSTERAATPSSAAYREQTVTSTATSEAPPASPAVAAGLEDQGGSGTHHAGPGGPVNGQTGNWLAQNAEGGVLQGVTPVALTLPGYARAITVTRELVTRQRPFRPVVIYATAWSLIPLLFLWLGCLALLARAHRPEIAALRARLRDRLARGAPSTVPAVPVVPGTSVPVPPPGPTAAG